LQGFEGAMRTTKGKKKIAAYLKMSKTPWKGILLVMWPLPQDFADHFMLHQPFSL
jgi:hypothetical protein